jgi:hypothetical protein
MEKMCPRNLFWGEPSRAERFIFHRKETCEARESEEGKSAEKSELIIHDDTGYALYRRAPEEKRNFFCASAALLGAPTEPKRKE